MKSLDITSFFPHNSQLPHRAQWYKWTPQDSDQQCFEGVQELIRTLHPPDGQCLPGSAAATLHSPFSQLVSKEVQHSTAVQELLHLQHVGRQQGGNRETCLEGDSALQLGSVSQVERLPMENRAQHKTSIFCQAITFNEKSEKFCSGLAQFEGNLEWFCLKPRWGGGTIGFELSTVDICFDSLHRAALSHDERREPEELVIKTAVSAKQSRPRLQTGGNLS